MFIPKQIKFWNHFNIKFIHIFIGIAIPEELQEYKEQIILWNKNLDINTAFVGQNIRMYYPALLDLPDDEMVMITDMDMLPANSNYYTSGLKKFTKDDFIYYRNIDGVQIYMCYNAAHPHTWKKLFNINDEDDIIRTINNTFIQQYTGIPGGNGWFSDQLIMYKTLINYEHLKVLNRCVRRLEVNHYKTLLNSNRNNFIHEFDDMHFHRSYQNNETLILNAEQQLLNNNIKIMKH